VNVHKNAKLAPAGRALLVNRIESRIEVHDAKQDCPTDPETPYGLVPQTAGADRPGQQRSAIRQDEVRP